MQPEAVVEDLYELEDCVTGLRAGRPCVQMNELSFKRCEEALGDGVEDARRLGAEAIANKEARVAHKTRRIRRGDCTIPSAIRCRHRLEIDPLATVQN